MSPSDIGTCKVVKCHIETFPGKTALTVNTTSEKQLEKAIGRMVGNQGQTVPGFLRWFRFEKTLGR